MSITSHGMSKLRVGIAILLIALALTMGSCKEKDLSFQASNTATNTTLKKSVLEFPAGLNLYGSNPNLPAGSVLIGFEHYEEGSFLKSIDLNYAYRGLVRFDLSSFNHKVLKATLEFIMKESKYQWKGAATNDKRSCASGLYIVTEDWFSGSYDKVAPGDLFVPLPNLLPGSSSFTSDDGRVKIANNQSFNIDVTPVVKDWLEKKKPNFGFMLIGASEAVESGSDHWTSIYGDFVLALTFEEISL